MPRCPEEIRAAAAERQRRWRSKIKSDPEIYAVYLNEQRMRSQTKGIVKKKLRSINEMSEDEKQIQRQKWRERQRWSRMRRGQIPEASPFCEGQELVSDVSVKDEYDHGHTSTGSPQHCTCSISNESATILSTPGSPQSYSCTSNESEAFVDTQGSPQNYTCAASIEPATILVTPDIPVTCTTLEPNSPGDTETAEDMCNIKIKMEEICCDKCYALCSNQEQACLAIQSLQKQIQTLEEELNTRRNGKCS